MLEYPLFSILHFCWPPMGLVSKIDHPKCVVTRTCLGYRFKVTKTGLSYLGKPKLFQNRIFTDVSNIQVNLQQNIHFLSPAL